MSDAHCLNHIYCKKLKPGKHPSLSFMSHLLSARLQTDLATCNIALLLPPD